MMRWISLFAILAVFSMMRVTPSAASSPVITGEISGVEICPQSLCGAAIFTGTFRGLVGQRLAAGFFWAAVKHEPLPEPGNTAAILGGKWNIATRANSFAGRILGGTLFNNGDNTFRVDATLELNRGGTGAILFSGSLDHNDLPPTLEGRLSQP